MLDKEDIKKKASVKIETIEKCYGRLHKERNITLKELERKHDLQSILERNFQIAIGACMDIGEILISYFGCEKPPENKDIFLKYWARTIYCQKSLPKSLRLPVALGMCLCTTMMKLTCINSMNTCRK